VVALSGPRLGAHFIEAFVGVGAMDINLIWSLKSLLNVRTWQGIVLAAAGAMLGGDAPSRRDCWLFFGRGKKKWCGNLFPSPKQNRNRSKVSDVDQKQVTS